jgi:hypothetical protein
MFLCIKYILSMVNAVYRWSESGDKENTMKQEPTEESDITPFNVTRSPTRKHKPSVTVEQDTIKKARIANKAETIDIDGQENVCPNDTGECHFLF